MMETQRDSGPREAPHLLTRSELAQLLGVDASTLSRWANNGVGPRCIRLAAGTLRYDLADVVAFIETRKSA